MDEVRNYILTHLDETMRPPMPDEGNVIGLPYPFTVPCIADKFQEMYYWDTYFTNVGLLKADKTELAKNNTDNVKSVIDRYGFMPNGTRTYFLSRSQPPFYAQMVKDVFAVTGDRNWLAGHVPTLEKEWAFWNEKRLSPCGLSAYGGDCQVQADYDKVSLEQAQKERAAKFCRRTGLTLSDTTPSQIRHIAQGYFSILESGLDCHFRFGADAEWMATVDLNALLFGLEDSLATFCDTLSLPQKAVWEQRKKDRLERMNTLMWNEDKGGFYDLNYHTGEQNPYFSYTAFWCMAMGLATEEQAGRLVEKLPLLEAPFGITNPNDDYVCGCQWDYPFGWAPVQYMTVAGLHRYGYEAEARRIASKYVDLVHRVYRDTHLLWEKYNVVEGTVAVSKENKTTPMMGWTAGVYLYLDYYLNQ